MNLSSAIHRINARTTIPDSVAKGIAALLVAVFALELVVRPVAGYFGAEVTRPVALLVFAVCFALFFAAAIRRLLGRATAA
jgi:hypothetical protein